MKLGYKRLKQREIFLAGIVFLISVSLFAQGKGGKKGKKDINPKNLYEVIIEPTEATIKVGDTLTVAAYLNDSLGNRIDTTFDWSVQNSRVGVIDNGVFVGLAKGNTQVIATIGRLAGKAKVTVEDTKSHPGRQGYNIHVVPHDTVLMIGQGVGYSAYLTDSTDTVIDTTFTWKLSKPEVGSLDSSQQFTAIAKGHSKVIASIGELEGSGNVVVLRDSNVWKNRKNGLKVIIAPHNLTLAIGDSLQFSAMLVDTNENVIDTTFTWSVEGGGFGDIDSTGLFYALAEGRGDVFASVGELSGKAKVKVLEVPKPGPRHGLKLVVEPRDTLLLINQTVQYIAYLQDTLGVKTETEAEWSSRGHMVGSMTASGLFTAETRGVGIVAAAWERFSGIAKAMVISEVDTTEKDTAGIRLSDWDGSQIGNIERVAEQEVLELSGIPFPLNVFNGASLTLPPGSLDEGVWIELTLPDLAVLEGDTAITFMDLIVAGVSFDIFVNDTLVSPYVFDPPVHLSLPYNQDLLDEIGISIDDLGMFFYNPDSTFDSTGITNVVIDTTEGRIEADISHFSQIVIGDASLTSATSIEDNDASKLPVSCKLYRNYPNPFNPVTTISFDIAGTGLQMVRLEIYNILGQQVSVLVDQSMQPGHYDTQWNGRNKTGELIGSGIYFYKLKVDDQIFVNKMSLIR